MAKTKTDLSKKEQKEVNRAEKDLAKKLKIPLSEAKELLSGTISKTTKTVSEFRKEFKKQAVTAITAAFAFLIALVWKDAIVDLVNKTQENLGISGEGELYLWTSAIFVTVIAVFALMMISKWATNPDKK